MPQANRVNFILRFLDFSRGTQWCILFLCLIDRNQNFFPEDIFCKHLKILSIGFPIWKWPEDVARGSGELRYQILSIDGLLTFLCVYVLMDAI